MKHQEKTKLPGTVLSEDGLPAASAEGAQADAEAEMGCIEWQLSKPTKKKVINHFRGTNVTRRKHRVSTVDVHRFR